MPKLNPTHLTDRLKEAIDQLEAGIEVEAKKNKTLLNAQQQKELDDAWMKQQALRKQQKPPKTEKEKKKIGWKDKREVRIEIYKQALNELNSNAVNDIKVLQQQREAKANRIYMDAWSKSVSEGKGGLKAVSAGNIALQRARFDTSRALSVSKRDLEIRKLEQQILEGFGNDVSEEQRDHLEWLKEGKKKVKKPKKE